MLPPGNSSVTVEMWTDRGRGGIVWGEGGWPLGIGGGGGGVETGHLTWHHLISWDNMHMVDWSDCRPLLSYSVKQEILDTCQLSMTLLHRGAPLGWGQSAMKSAIIREQWKFEYSDPPTQRGRTPPTTLGQVEFSLGQRQPCPGARNPPCPRALSWCPAAMIGLQLTTDPQTDNLDPAANQGIHFTVVPWILLRPSWNKFSLTLSQ